MNLMCATSFPALTLYQACASIGRRPYGRARRRGRGLLALAAATKPKASSQLTVDKHPSAITANGAV